MKLSTKSRYGSRAVIEIAKKFKEGPVKRKDIVKSQEISDSYLENILIILKNRGIIDTVRGANGGYMLSRPASEITLLEIVNALDGTLSPVECIDNPSSCHKIDMCSTRYAWKRLKDAQEDVLRSITIQEMVEHEKKAFVPDYII